MGLICRRYFCIFQIKTEESSDDSDVIIESEYINPVKQGNFVRYRDYL